MKKYGCRSYKDKMRGRYRQHIRHALAPCFAAGERREVGRVFLEVANDIAWEWDMATNRLLFWERCREGLHIRNEYDGFEEFVTLIPQEDQELVRSALTECLTRQRGMFTFECRIMTSQGLKWVIMRGKAVFGSGGKPLWLAGTVTDVTHGKMQEEAIRYLTYFDVVTGLPNRISMQEALHLALREKRNRGAILYFDVDKFKAINDTLGVSLGDNILFMVAEMLRERMGSQHLLAKVGDDEFVILLNDISDRASVQTYAKHILACFAEPLKVGNRSIRIAISVGIALLPEDGTTMETLIKHAELALSRAKGQPDNRIAFFEQSMADEAYRKLVLEEDLRHALNNGELLLYYQPIVDCSTGKVSGFEALLRWNSPQLGMVSPLQFIRLAEETGLIIPIGLWVLQQGCAFLARLHRAGYVDMLLSVNVSIIQLLQSDFVESMWAVVRDAGIPPEHIAFEITEGLLMETFEANSEKLRLLRQRGMKIHLDDFGTGYSSLKYLQNLPVDLVKIDKSFIDELEGNEQTVQLVDSIIALVHRLGLQTVAEGVETGLQHSRLACFGCDRIQGYLISKPMPEEQVLSFLKAYKPRQDNSST